MYELTITKFCYICIWVYSFSEGIPNTYEILAKVAGLLIELVQVRNLNIKPLRTISEAEYVVQDSCRLFSVDIDPCSTEITARMTT